MIDPHSYARPAEARVTHVALDLGADFDAKVLAGTAALRSRSPPRPLALTLDTRGLAIERVSTDAAGAPAATHALGGLPTRPGQRR